MKTRETTICEYEALMLARIEAKDDSPELTTAIAAMNEWLIRNGAEFDLYIKREKAA